MTNDAPHGNPHNPTEEHPTGPNLTVGQVPDEHTYQSVYSRTDAEQADPEPDPVEVWKRFGDSSSIRNIRALWLLLPLSPFASQQSCIRSSPRCNGVLAAKQLVLPRSSADTAIKTMRIDQRAWVGGGPASALIELEKEAANRYHGDT